MQEGQGIAAMPEKEAAHHSEVLSPMDGDGDYWYGPINETEAARFVGFTVRALQGWRYGGGGPLFVRVNQRCVRYRRVDLREWSEARLRTSTSDPGQEAA